MIPQSSCAQALELGLEGSPQPTCALCLGDHGFRQVPAISVGPRMEPSLSGSREQAILFM